MKNKQEFYKPKIDFLDQKITQIKTRLNNLVIIRVVLFLAAFATLYFFYDSNKSAAWLGFVGFIGGFLFLVRKFESLKSERDFHKLLKQINQTEIEALNGSFENLANGKEFEDPLHPFASDFDLFGDRSIFQFLNRSFLPAAKALMAHNLKHENLNPKSIVASQEAVEELSNQVDFRQKLHALNFLKEESENNSHFLINWAKTPILSVRNKFTTLAIWVFPAIAFTTLLAQVLGFISISLAIYFYVLPLIVVGYFLKNINQQHGVLGKAELAVNSLEKVLIEIEQKSFQSNYLKQLQEKVTQPQKASEAINELKTVTKYFDQRSNLIVGILLNVFFLWDIRLAFRFEKWKKQHAGSLENWMDVVAEIEYLSSLGNFKFNYPKSVFPSFTEKEDIVAEELGHPLILKDRINNDFAIKSEKHMVILTGANMAGKSTFLRSLGVNLILGMMGAPVIAQKLSFKPTKIFSGMRTADSLQENASYFFAELKRLSTIVKQLEKGEKPFVILDEILKGTNSKDKEEGSIKLIKRLLNLNAGGIIATHDLGLCNLEKDFPNHITNMAFETEIKDNELHFDYKIKKGVCQTMNASFLMEKMGITSSLS